MNNIFLEILNLSFTASIVIVAVLVFRLFLKKAPKIFSYALWGVVLFRLLVPFSFESVIGLLPKNEPIPQDIVVQAKPQINSGFVFIDNAVNEILPPVVNIETVSVNPIEMWIFIGVTIWSVGILALLIYSVSQYILLKRKLVGKKPLYDNVYLSDGINSPFVMGMFRPKIYLPSSLPKNEYEFIIAHEKCHIKRLDHITRILAFVALALHWFNPLVWIAYILSAKDMEMSCDEAVMKTMDSDIRKEYATSLLRISTGKKVIFATPLTFGEGDPKGRVKNIMKYKKPLMWVSVIAVIVVGALTIGFMSRSADNTFNIKYEFTDNFIESVVDYTDENIESKSIPFSTAYDDVLTFANANLSNVKEGAFERAKVAIIYGYLNVFPEIADRILVTYGFDINQKELRTINYIMFADTEEKFNTLNETMQSHHDEIFVEPPFGNQQIDEEGTLYNLRLRQNFDESLTNVEITEENIMGYYAGVLPANEITVSLVRQVVFPDDSVLEAATTSASTTEPTFESSTVQHTGSGEQITIGSLFENITLGGNGYKFMDYEFSTNISDIENAIAQADYTKITNIDTIDIRTDILIEDINQEAMLTYKFYQDLLYGIDLVILTETAQSEEVLNKLYLSAQENMVAPISGNFEDILTLSPVSWETEYRSSVKLDFPTSSDSDYDVIYINIMPNNDEEPSAFSWSDYNFEPTDSSNFFDNIFVNNGDEIALKNISFKDEYEKISAYANTFGGVTESTDEITISIIYQTGSANYDKPIDVLNRVEDGYGLFSITYFFNSENQDEHTVINDFLYEELKNSSLNLSEDILSTIYDQGGFVYQLNDEITISVNTNFVTLIPTEFITSPVYSSYDENGILEQNILRTLFEVNGNNLELNNINFGDNYDTVLNFLESNGTVTDIYTESEIQVIGATMNFANNVVATYQLDGDDGLFAFNYRFIANNEEELATLREYFYNSAIEFLPEPANNVSYEDIKNVPGNTIFEFENNVILGLSNPLDPAVFPIAYVFGCTYDNDLIITQVYPQTQQIVDETNNFLLNIINTNDGKFEPREITFDYTYEEALNYAEDNYSNVEEVLFESIDTKLIMGTTSFSNIVNNVLVVYTFNSTLNVLSNAQYIFIADDDEHLQQINLQLQQDLSNLSYQQQEIAEDYSFFNIIFSEDFDASREGITSENIMSLFAGAIETNSTRIGIYREGSADIGS